MPARRPSRRQKALFFFEKKNQKTFDSFSGGGA
jgi:hypothetical protein